MSALSATTTWIRTHPLLSDAVTSCVIFVVCLNIRPQESHRTAAKSLTPAALVLLASACVALVLRRRYPWTVWCTTTTLGLAGVVISQGPSQVMLPAALALYTVATLNSWRVALTATALTASLPVALIIMSGAGYLDASTYGLAAWSCVAAVSGIAVRSQRAVIASARERAIAAENNREEEAQRRVTEERLRIARDVHDVVAHYISVINVQAGVAEHFLRSDPIQAEEAIGHVREASRIALREVPGLLGLLRTADSKTRTSPAPRLADYGELIEMARRAGLRITLRSHGTRPQLAPSIDLTAYRILQESLTNAAKYGTGNADVSLAFGTNECTLTVRNEIKGGTSPRERTERHGTLGMRERVSAVHGTLSIGPDVEGNWVVSARLPTRHQVTPTIEEP